MRKIHIPTIPPNISSKSADSRSYPHLVSNNSACTLPACYCIEVMASFCMVKSPSGFHEPAMQLTVLHRPNAVQR